MVFENSSHESEEIFLGTYSEREISIFFPSLMIRQQKKYNRGVNKYFDVFVNKRELHNFLLQAKADLEEEKEKIARQKQSFELLSILPGIDLKGEEIIDEVFIGFYPNVASAKMAFGFFESIRGGNFAEYAPLQSNEQDEDMVIETKLIPLYYFFVENKEFLEYMERLKKDILQNCENYKYMKIFYDEMKKFEGG